MPQQFFLIEAGQVTCQVNYVRWGNKEEKVFIRKGNLTIDPCCACWIKTFCLCQEEYQAQAQHCRASKAHGQSKTHPDSVDLTGNYTKPVAGSWAEGLR